MEPDLPDPEILFSHVCTPGVLYTRSSFLGVLEFFLGCVLDHSYVNPWYWVNRSILPWYFSPIKESIVTRLCMLLYCIEKNLCDCVIDIVRA